MNSSEVGLPDTLKDGHYESSKENKIQIIVSDEKLDDIVGSRLGKSCNDTVEGTVVSNILSMDDKHDEHSRKDDDIRDRSSSETSGHQNGERELDIKTKMTEIDDSKASHDGNDIITEDIIIQNPVSGEKYRLPNATYEDQASNTLTFDEEDTLPRQDQDTTMYTIGRGKFLNAVPVRGKCWVCKETVVNHREVFCECQGFQHKTCLIKWMNGFCKGRCPVCAYKYRVKTHKQPVSEWKPDPLLTEHKKRYIIMVSLNILVIIVVAIVLIQLTDTMEEQTTAKRAIAGIIGTVFGIYALHQSRIYWRLYERLKIFNNKVSDVLEISDAGKAIARGNISSFMNESEIHK